MKIADELKKRRNEPRDIDPERAWYYVNRGSVDLVLRDPNVATVSHRIPRRWLEAMLLDMNNRKRASPPREGER